MRKNFQRIFLVLFFVLISQFIQAQKLDKRIYEKNFYKALDYIYEQNYAKALDILYALDSVQAPQFLKNSAEYQFYVDSQYINLEQVYIKYLIAVCHLEKEGNPKTALPYIEYVLESGYSNTPVIIYKDLGRLYHLDYQFDKAIYYFNKYLENVSQKDEFYLFSKYMINTCKNAKEIVKDTVYKQINNLRGNVNSPDCSEYQIALNNEGTVLYFERELTKPQISKIFVSYKQFDIWTKAKALQFPTSFLANAKAIRIAGMDFNQNNLLVYKDTETASEVFLCEISDDKVIVIQPMNFTFIGFNDGRVCYGKTQKEIYFSSARIGGQGGYDIFKVNQKMNGQWEAPENLKEINSSFDEVDPFFNRVNSILYYSSSSFNSIGGFDIFTSQISKMTIGNPQNIGFAINTVGSNRSFFVPISQNIGYYSSNQSNSVLLQDIYSVKLNKTIPLTLLNGTFQAGNPPQPVDLKLTVIDEQTNSRVKYSFASKADKGKYYIIFEPGKVYDLIFEVVGYKAQNITVEIPEQEYFYQIFQTINLIPLDEVNSEHTNELIVKNDFYDIGDMAQDSLENYKKDMVKLFSEVVDKIDSIDEFTKLNIADAQKHTNTEAPNYYDDLLNMIESTIVNQDTATINQLFEKCNKSQVYSISYNTSIENNSDYVVVNGDTIKTAPSLKAYQDLSSERISKLIGAKNMVVPVYNDSTLNNANVAFQYEMVFVDEDYSIPAKYFSVLNDIISLMNDNPYLQLVIEGYSENVVKDRTMELHITKQKAELIYDYLNTQNCKCGNVLIHTSLSPNPSKKIFDKKYYFILVKIFDLNK